MSAEDDLKQSVANLTSAVGAAVTEIQNEATAIAAALASAGTTDPAATTKAIEDAVGNINILTGNLNAAVAAATPPAAAPAAASTT